MVEIEGSANRIYMSIRLSNVLGNRGMCRDTARGWRAFVVVHAVVLVREEDRGTGDIYRWGTGSRGNSARRVNE